MNLRVYFKTENHKESLESVIAVFSLNCIFNRLQLFTKNISSSSLGANVTLPAPTETLRGDDRNTL